MQAVGVSEYGPVENLHSKAVPKPGKPTGRQLLVLVKAGKVGSCLIIWEKNTDANPIRFHSLGKSH